MGDGEPSHRGRALRRQFHARSPAKVREGIIAQHGLCSPRLPIRWERTQPVLNGKLIVAELLRMQQSVSAARVAGRAVILDMHNCIAYWLDESGIGGAGR